MARDPEVVRIGLIVHEVLEAACVAARAERRVQAGLEACRVSVRPAGLIGVAVAPERIARGERARRDSPGFADAFDGGLSLLHGLSLRLDALAHAWTEWVLSYDSSHQKRLLARFGFSFDSWHDLAGLLAAALMLTISAVALFTLHPRPPRDAAEAAFAAFCAKLARRGVARASHETASQLLLRAEEALDAEQRAQALRIVTLYNALRYASAQEQTVGVRHLRQLVRAFG